jgi:hypothetical protein
MIILLIMMYLVFYLLDNVLYNGVAVCNVVQKKNVDIIHDDHICDRRNERVNSQYKLDIW